MIDTRVNVVVTGTPEVQLLACKLCGVLLWDIDAHYTHAHPPKAITAEERAAVLASDTPNRCPKCGEDYPATKFGRNVHELTCVRPMPEVAL